MALGLESLKIRWKGSGFLKWNSQLFSCSLKKSYRSKRVSATNSSLVKGPACFSKPPIQHWPVTCKFAKNKANRSTFIPPIFMHIANLYTKHVTIVSTPSVINTYWIQETEGSPAGTARTAAHRPGSCNFPPKPCKNKALPGGGAGTSWTNQLQILAKRLGSFTKYSWGGRLGLRLKKSGCFVFWKGTLKNGRVMLLWLLWLLLLFLFVFFVVGSFRMML